MAATDPGLAFVGDEQPWPPTPSGPVRSEAGNNRPAEALRCPVTTAEITVGAKGSFRGTPCMPGSKALTDQPASAGGTKLEAA